MSNLSDTEPLSPDEEAMVEELNRAAYEYAVRSLRQTEAAHE